MAGKTVAFCFGGALAAALGYSHVAGAANPPMVKDFMSGLGFSGSRLAALQGGEIVSRVLETEMAGPNESAEVAVLGAVRVDVTRQAFIAAVKDISGFCGNSQRIVHVVHEPPQASDFAALALPAEDFGELKKCRPGNCALRLTAEGLAELQADIDWKAEGTKERMNASGRARLLAIATAYTESGMKAVHPMLDAPTAVNIDEQFRQLVERTPQLIAFYPEFAAYVRDYPKATLPSSSETLYWTIGAFGLKPTITLIHVVEYAPPGTEDVVVAWKQVYASHYFNGALGITVYARDATAAYMIHFDRVRADGLGGAFGGVKRGRMAAAIEGELRGFLKTAADALRARAGK